MPIMPIYPQADKSPALNWRTSCRVDAGLSSNLCSSLSERSWTKPQASLLAVKSIQVGMPNEALPQTDEACILSIT